MYVSPDYKAKKELKEAVAAGKEVTVFSPGPFPPNKNGVEFVEGPHYPEPHRWYAKVEVRNGKVIRVID